MTQKKHVNIVSPNHTTLCHNSYTPPPKPVSTNGTALHLSIKKDLNRIKKNYMDHGIEIKRVIVSIAEDVL